jgi:hypothetical protein
MKTYLKQISCYFLFCFFLPVITFGQTISLKGQVIDFFSETEIQGVFIGFYKDNKLIKYDQTDLNGNFELVISEKIDWIEFSFIGYVSLRITDLDFSQNWECFSVNIPLFVSPFGLIGWIRPPTRKQKNEIREKREFIINGVDFNCRNNYSVLIKFKEIQHKQFQYISFEELMKCSDCDEDKENN